MGKREEALGVTEESVAVYRELAKRNPEAYGGDLALALGGLGTCYKALEILPKARDCFAEGLACLRPLYLRIPSAFEGLMKALVSEYLEVTETLKSAPDAELLQFIQEHQLGPRDTETAEEWLQWLDGLPVEKLVEVAQKNIGALESATTREEVIPPLFMTMLFGQDTICSKLPPEVQEQLVIVLQKVEAKFGPLDELLGGDEPGAAPVPSA
jgi:tetratricopeptide (TPR) repeat protein